MEGGREEGGKEREETNPSIDGCELDLEAVHARISIGVRHPHSRQFSGWLLVSCVKEGEEGERDEGREDEREKSMGERERGKGEGWEEGRDQRHPHFLLTGRQCTC